MIPTQSSMIVGIAFDDEDETVYVRFKQGLVYKYSYMGDVGNYAAACVARILFAQSQGQMVNKLLKSGEFLVGGPLTVDELPDFHA